MPPTTTLTGDPSRDELLMARLDAERRCDDATRAIVRALECGRPLRQMRRLLDKLREAKAELALVAHLVRALDADEAEDSL